MSEQRWYECCYERCLGTQGLESGWTQKHGAPKFKNYELMKIYSQKKFTSRLRVKKPLLNRFVIAWSSVLSHWNLQFLRKVGDWDILLSKLKFSFYFVRIIALKNSKKVPMSDNLKSIQIFFFLKIEFTWR